MCEPDTWPHYPLLAIRRKTKSEQGTLLHTSGQPRNVIFATCSEVQMAIDAGVDPLTHFPGSDDLTVNPPPGIRPPQKPEPYSSDSRPIWGLRKQHHQTEPTRERILQNMDSMIQRKRISKGDFI